MTLTAASPDLIEVHRPTDGSPLESVPVDSPERVAEIVAGCRGAQGGWRDLGFDGRIAWLGRLRDWILDNQETLEAMLQAESGKVRADASFECVYLLEAISFWSSRGPGFIADEKVTPHSPILRTRRAKIVYHPHPVAGIIAPWNFPLILTLGDAIPALLAGCSVVIKPSQLTPLTIGRLVRAWREDLGAPPVLDLANGGAETAGALIDEAGFVGFTGSVRVGKEVMRRAADTLTPLSLELGGKDPMIVTRSADVERAANAAAFGGLMNAGQICLSVERVYVEEPIYDDFVELLRANVERLRQADDSAGGSADLGAMTSPAQLEIVAEHVAEARAAGARILTGGRRREGPGTWYEPTVIADADHSMRVMRDETFGPVVAVMKVRDADEAVELANDSIYGLGGAVFAGDTDEAERVARRVEAGTVAINDLFPINYAMLGLPMGGWKSSGVGYRHGAAGIRKFCRTESLTIPRFRQPKREPVWFPRTRLQNDLLRRLYRLLNARDLRRRLGL